MPNANYQGLGSIYMFNKGIVVGTLSTTIRSCGMVEHDFHDGDGPHTYENYIIYGTVRFTLFF